jgi:hypothetical protein
MKKYPKRFLTAAEFRALSPHKFQPLGHRGTKESALLALQDWTGTLSPSSKAEAKEKIDIAARRYLYFRERSEAVPTKAELKRMLDRLLQNIQEFHRFINNLNYWEAHWLNSRNPIVAALQLDLEGGRVRSSAQSQYCEERGILDPPRPP